MEKVRSYRGSLKFQLLLLTVLMLITSVASFAATDHIVISEVQITGGSASDDYIELYNPMDVDFDLDGYRLVKRTADGTSDTTIKSWTSSEIILSHGYYLWANSGWTPSILPDVSSAGLISADNGIALRQGSENTGAIIDSVAWGTVTNVFIEGSAYPTNPTAGQSLERKSEGTSNIYGNGKDTDDNNADFEIKTTPNPQNSTSCKEGLSFISVSTSNCEIKTIKNALGNATKGDIINVSPGTYYGQLSIDKNNLVLQSTGGAINTIIDLAKPTETTGIWIKANNTAFNGFTVKNITTNGNYAQYALRIRGSNNSILNNIIIGQASRDWWNDEEDSGINIDGTSDTISSNNVIEYNEIYEFSAMGIQVAGSGKYNAHDNIIRYNSIHDIDYYAIVNDRSANQIIQENTLTDIGPTGHKTDGYYATGVVVYGINSTGTQIISQDVNGSEQGIALSAVQKVLIDNCEISNNDIGIKIADSSWITNITDNNTIVNNGIHDNLVGILLASSGNKGLGMFNIINWNDIYNNANIGLKNEVDIKINAENNYWGCVEGPNKSVCDTTSGDVDYDPWLEGIEIETVNGYNVLNNTNKTSSSLNITTTGPVNVRISKSNVTAQSSFLSSNIKGFKTIEINVSDSNSVQFPVYFKVYYTLAELTAAGLTEDKLVGMFWYNPATTGWELLNETGVVTDNFNIDNTDYEGYVWANLYHFSLYSPGTDVTKPITSAVLATPNPAIRNGTLVNLTAKITDETAQNWSKITAAEYFINTFTGDGTGVSMSSLDGSFNNESENVFALIDISALARGNHIISVHGKDENNNWGNLTNVTLIINNAAPFNKGTVSSISFNEDGYHDSLDLDSYFFDYDSDDLNYTKTCNASQLIVSINNMTGIVNFSANLDWFGHVKCNFTAYDYQNASLNRTNDVFIQVLSVNDIPKLPFNYSQFLEDTTQSIDLTTKVTDVESAASDINWSLVSGADNLTITINNVTNTLTIVPDKNFTTYSTGLRLITLKAIDPDGGVNTTIVKINVTNTNDAPSLNLIGNRTVIQDKPIAVNVSKFAYDIDPTNDVLSYYITDAPGGTINQNSGLYSWTPDHNFLGNQLINFTVSDGQFNTSQIIKIEVFGTLNISNVTLNNKRIVDGEMIQNLFPNDEIEIVVHTQNIGSDTIDNVNITLDIPDIYYGSIFTNGNWSEVPFQRRSFLIKIPTIINESVYNGSIKVEGKNFFPQFRRIDVLNFSLNITKEKGVIIIEDLLLDNDSVQCTSPVVVRVNITNTGLRDFVDDVAVSIVNSDLGFVRRVQGITLLSKEYNDSIVFDINTGNVTAGIYPINATMTYYHSFSTNRSDSKVVNLNIKNCIPSNIAVIPAISIKEDSYNDSLNLKNYFTDYNNDTLQFIVNGNTTNLVFNSFLTTGLLNITPAANHTGTQYINFSAKDYTGTTVDSNKIKVTINNINDAPLLFVDNQLFAENVTKTFFVSAFDFDPTNQVLTFGTNATFGTFTIKNATHYIFNWTPSNDDVGSYSVLFSVSDGIVSVTKTITITVNNINNAPVLAAIPDLAATEDSLFSYILTASDAESNTLSYTSNMSSVMRIVKINNTRANVSWTPTYLNIGDNFVLFTVTDDGAPQKSDSQVVKITVSSVNDVPIISAISDMQIPALETFRYAVHATDEESQTLSYSIKAGSSGNMNINSTGGFSWTPQNSEIGQHLIKIEVSDSIKTAEENFTITVVPPIVIGNVKIKVNNGVFKDLAEGGIGRVRPTDKIYLQYNISNALTGSSIYGIEINSTIQGLPNGDLVGVSGISSILPGKSAINSVVLGNIDVSSAGSYKLLIKASGKDQSNQQMQDNWNATINVESDIYQLSITSKSIDKSSVTCNRSVFVTATVKNINKVSIAENVRLKVQNTAIGVDKSTPYVQILKGSSATFLVPFNITKDKPVGKYNLTITAESANTVDISSVELTVGACSLVYSPDVSTVYLSSIANQDFSVSIPSDFEVKSTTWELLNSTGHYIVSNTPTYSYKAENKDGLNTRKLKLTTVAKDGYSKTREWTIKATTYPITDTFTVVSPDLSKLNKTQLKNVNLTLQKTNIAKIVFLRSLDLSNIVVIDGHINVTAGIVAFDTTDPPYNIFAVPVRITMYGLTYNEAPKIYSSTQFTTDPTKFSVDSCMGIFCFIESQTAPPTTNGEVRFNTTISSSFRVGTSIVVPPSNAAVADAGTPQTVSPNTLVTLDASASTGDAPLTYLWTPPTGITLSSLTAQKPTFTPTTAGVYTFTLTVTNAYGQSTDSVTITVQTTVPTATDNLTISDLDVKVGSKSDKGLNNGDRISEEALPGDTVVLDIEFQNTFDYDIDIEDIDVEVTIANIDDGDDLDAEDTISKIKDGNKERVKFEFIVPDKVDEDVYDITIYASGEDEEGRSHSVEWVIELEVKKDKHKVSLYGIDLSPTTVQCSRVIGLDVSVRNIGQKDEETDIKVTNSQLGINDKRSFDLDPDIDDSDNEQTARFTFSIDEDVKPGVYPINIEAEYNNGDDSETETAILTVQDCVVEQPPEKEEIDEGIDVQIITGGDTIPTLPIVTPVDTTVSFRDTTEYLVLLAIVTILLLGGVIYAIGAAIILSRRR
ncbi:MAG: tandem-95 repeat protein [Nanoarchaeota archaeon]